MIEEQKGNPHVYVSPKSGSRELLAQHLKPREFFFAVGSCEAGVLESFIL
ncbi:rCG38683, partial [Rattus norvegicus]